MVKNDLSVRAQQTQNVAVKLASNTIEKLKLEATKNIVAINGRIPFKSNESEEKLHLARINSLKKNIDSLFYKSELASKAEELKNYYEFKKYEWSFVKIDRTNPDKEQIRKIISLERQRYVTRENKYLRASFNAKWHEKEMNEHINYRLQLEEHLQKIYGDKTKLAEVSFTEFYNNLVKEHNLMLQKAKEELGSFYDEILKVLNNSYQIAFAKSERETIFTLSSQVVELYNKALAVSIEIENQNVDLQVLIEQGKEKLDVFEEKEELLKAIEQNKKEKETLQNNISELLAKINEAYDAYEQAKNKLVEVDEHLFTETQQVVLKKVSEAFTNNSFEEAFETIFKAVKEYVLSLCPFFYSYFEEKEKKYDEKVADFRKANAESMEKETAKIYLKEREYIKYLAGSNDKCDLTSLENSHKQRLQEIKEAYHARLEKLKQDREVRKAEYKEQKANAKVTLKLADSVKATEVKEVVKLYKKAINAGELKRKREAFIAYIKEVIAENKRYKKEVQKETLPDTLIYVLEHENFVKALAKEKAKENAKLSKELRKESRLSKYKKNSTAKKRENGLGYLFLSIWAVGFIILTLYPILYVFFMSFNDFTYSIATKGYPNMLYANGEWFPVWKGFDNFETLFLADYEFTFTLLPQFFRSLLFYLPIVVFIAFVLAMLLNTKIKGRTFFRIVYFLPVVIVSGPVLTMLNQNNTSGSSSIRLTLDGSSVAKILLSISPKALEIANEVFSNFIIILWMTGVPIVLFISALQKINRQLYEAAEIDGANKWQMLWTITFPLIKSVLMIVCLFTIMQITTINVSFVNPIIDWIDTKLKSTSYNLGILAVGAWMQTILVLLFVIVSFLLFREKEFVSKDKNYEEMEEIKRIKQQRKAKIYAFLHINDIKAFFTKLFAPISKFIHTRKAKKKEKEEMGGM